jgi:hypothetical protein
LFHPQVNVGGTFSLKPAPDHFGLSSCFPAGLFIPMNPLVNVCFCPTNLFVSEQIIDHGVKKLAGKI